MQKKDSFRRVSINNNVQETSGKKSQKNENNNSHIRTRLSINPNNHVIYNSNSNTIKAKDKINKENLKILANNNTREESQKEELDHPKPLETEIEDLDELKSQFNKNCDFLEKTKDSSEGPESDKNSKNEKILIINTDIKNKNNIKNSNNNISCQSENINLIKKQRNNDNKIGEKKSKDKKINPFISNEVAKNINDSYNNLNKTINKRIHNDNESPKYKNINMIRRSQNYLMNKENMKFINIENNCVIKNQNKKNKIFPKTKTFQSKASFNLLKSKENETVRKLVYEKCEKNNNDLKEKNLNIKQNLTKNYLRNKNQIENIIINDKNSIKTYTDSQALTTEKKIKNRNINENSSNKKNIINNTIVSKNLIKPSIEIKEPDHLNNRISINYEMNNSVNKSRKNTFDHIPNFNNTKTTYVVISKKSKNQIPKVNVIPKTNGPKNIKISSQNSSINFNKNFKLIVPNSYSSLDEKINSNRQRNFFINKSQKKLRTISRDRYEENYKNYLEPSINENNQNHVNQKINKKSILINKFVDNKQNMNHQYDYDYNNYNYFYDNFNYSSNLVPINYTSFYNGNYLY